MPWNTTGKGIRFGLDIIKYVRLRHGLVDVQG